MANDTRFDSSVDEARLRNLSGSRNYIAVLGVAWKRGFLPNEFVLRVGLVL